jgi:Gluconate 2-dehydrogenase subunit 3
MTDHESSGISRREAIQRVSVLLGGLTLVGGSALITACEKRGPAAAARAPIGEFTVQDIELLDEIADTILPTTSTPGAKAAQTGAFMALMVTDTYKPTDRQVFRAGLVSLDEASRKAHGVTFMAATPAQRLTVLEALDREQHAHGEARDAARKGRSSADTTKAEAATTERFLPGPQKEAAAGSDVGPATAITAATPTHYFRMMKELALLGYFTSEIGCTQAMRYIESPGRFDPCVPYQKGEKAWAGHA